MDPDVFKEQLFYFNLYNVFIVAGFILVSLLFFKNEDKSKISQNESTWRNLKFLFLNPQSRKTIIAVCIPNGLLIVLGSIINIIAIDQGFDSAFASLMILFATLSGLLASILYTVIFFKLKNHSYNFAVMMGLSAVVLGFGGYGLYSKSQSLFGAMFILVGVFAFPIIPFLMEKNSLDFPSVSFNIINLSKWRANRSLRFRTLNSDCVLPGNFDIVHSQI